ncbi:2,3,4,5-tetrahydropyridine-2,6-dicarboxylate N-succinyltransferase, partial [bacterium]
MTDSLRPTIEAAWERRAQLNPGNADAATRSAIEEAIAQLDSGRLRIAEKTGEDWTVHEWLKKAVLLYFRVNDNRLIEAGHTRY